MRQPSAARAAAVLLQLPPYPLHNHVYGVALLAVRKPASARYSVPLLKTSAAAARRGVLRYEHRMAAHGRLPAVVRRTGRGEAAAYEACRMAAYHVASLPYGIGHAVSVKPETASERRAREPVEQRVEVVAPPATFRRRAGCRRQRVRPLRARCVFSYRRVVCLHSQPGRHEAADGAQRQGRTQAVAAVAATAAMNAFSAHVRH